MLNAHFTGISAESAWLHAWGGHTTPGKKIVEAVACRRRSEGSKAQLGALNFRSGHPWCGMRQDTNRASIERFMHELAGGVRSPGHVYFTGGVSAVLLGWRAMTMDVDLKADPEPAGFFECLPRLKDELDINIELAAPDQFVPTLAGWRERSVLIAQHGPLTFHHYDFYSQALAKIERGHARDRHDVGHMLAAGLVVPAQLLELFAEAEPRLARYPAIDAPSLRARVMAVAAGQIWS